MAITEHTLDRAGFACRLCDGEELALYYVQGNDDRYRYYKCRHCGLVNLDLSTGLDQTHLARTFLDPTDDSIRVNRVADPSFEFLLAKVSDTRSFCDIGCGNGRLLYRAQRAGWQVLGVELSKTIAEATADKLGVEVIATDFLRFTPSPEQTNFYDTVCLRHVLEHLPDSRLAMRKISTLLRAGGHALIEMPNIEALDKRLKRFIANAGLHRRRYREGFAPGHCNEFCRHSFEYLLRETGFRLVKWETYSKKPLINFFVNRVHIGNKARSLIQKVA